MNWESTKQYAYKIFSRLWVQWVHEGTYPAETSGKKMLNTILGTLISSHCPQCMNLNGCCFVKEKAPSPPLHDHCHCYMSDISGINPVVECPTEKFSGYIFSENKSGGKKDLFESWGYNIIDSTVLAQEFTNQAKLAYLSGEYYLGNLDQFGQRISILITLPRKVGTGTVSFVSGWMVYPNGKIILTMPYGGKIHETA